jgi:signal peptide peptidase SppA
MSEAVRAWELLKAQQWLMTQEALDVLASVALRQNSVEEYEALQAQRGEPLRNARRAVLRGETENVALIPVVGPIFPRANLFSMMSGATSGEIIAQDLRTALEDRTVDAVVLEIDSPGGAVAGINELAGMIWDARKQKPVIAYGMHQVASAAYWLASAAQEIVIDRTSPVGSIGVVLQVQDSTARDERAGVRSYTIVSSVSPDKVLNPADEKGRAKLQKVADDMAAVFVETVARNRGVSIETVLANYGQGAQLIGDAAVKAGMADRIGSLDQVIDQLSAEGRAAHNRRFFIMARGPINVSNTQALRDAFKAGHTAEEISIVAVDAAAIETAAKQAGATEERTKLEAVHATALKDGATAAREEGVQAERKRIAGINAVTLPGFEAEAQKAIAGGTTAEQFAVEQATAQKSRGTSRVQQNRDAPAALGHAAPGDATEAQQKAGQTRGVWDKAVAKVTPISAAARK